MEAISAGGSSIVFGLALCEREIVGGEVSVERGSCYIT